jgi:hypothetical protein
MKASFAIPAWTLLLLASCQSEEARLREEAQRMVELYQAIKYEAPAEVRAEKLKAIEQAVFVSPEVVGTRTICLSGHRQLVAAQQSQDETAKEIDRALRASDSGGPLDADAIGRLQATLGKAQEQLGKARIELSACEEQVRGLDVRLGKR